MDCKNDDLLQWQRQVLECLVQVHFPNILEMANERGNVIDVVSLGKVRP